MRQRQQQWWLQQQQARVDGTGLGGRTVYCEVAPDSCDVAYFELTAHPHVARDCTTTAASASVHR